MEGWNNSKLSAPVSFLEPLMAHVPKMPTDATMDEMAPMR